MPFNSLEIDGMLKTALSAEFQWSVLSFLRMPDNTILRRIKVLSSVQSAWLTSQLTIQSQWLSLTAAISTFTI
jgi:hypothetical protein